MNRRIRSPNPSPSSSRIEERLHRFLKPGALARLRDSRISNARSPRSAALPASRPPPPPPPGRRRPRPLRSKGSSLVLRLGPAARGSSSGRSSPPPSPSSTPPRARSSPIPSWTPSAWIWSPRTELGRTLLGF
ncbi:unnamed protein product [Musa acuminata subsp. burmannicoides]